MQKERAESKEATMNREPVKGTERESLTNLKDASRDLKEQIIEQKRKNDMPINSSLGGHEVDARNADGHTLCPTASL